MSDNIWKTAITDIGPGKIRIKGYDIADIMENLSGKYASRDTTSPISWKICHMPRRCI